MFSEYDTFIYHGYKLTKDDDGIFIEYNFEIPSLAFFHPTERIKTENLEIINNFDSNAGKYIVFCLGMVELISYWKCACPENVIVECGYLSESDIEWWKKLYLSGLSEFFYRNNIEPDKDKFMHIKCNAKKSLSADVFNTSDKNIIPVGGGKDSDVTMHLLRDFGDKNLFITVNDQKAREDGIKAAGYSGKNIIRTYRTISPELLELNKRGFLNGHTPFSAIVAFLSLYAAYLEGSKYIILSNESSANESNIEGTFVNHQYSKSFEFECDFKNYVKENITDNIDYFSILRPFNEMQIAKQFAALPEYHDVFRSCNAGSKKNIWCCNCAKCLFVYIILSPFIKPHELLDIFGENLLDKESLTGLFDGLVGFSDVKPFECIGTKREINAALINTIGQYEKDGQKLPFLLAYYKAKTAGGRDETKELLTEFEQSNNVPEKFKNAVSEMYNYVSK